jgi:hypothetical protein
MALQHGQWSRLQLTAWHEWSTLNLAHRLAASAISNPLLSPSLLLTSLTAAPLPANPLDRQSLVTTCVWTTPYSFRSFETFPL